MQVLDESKMGKSRFQSLERWIDFALLWPSLDLAEKDKKLTQAAAFKGLTKNGISRQQLLQAGISDDLIERLYRGLYVHSVGLFDMLQVKTPLTHSLVDAHEIPST